MAKGQMRSNKETRKPKKDAGDKKKKDAAPPTLGATKASPGKKS